MVEDVLLCLGEYWIGSQLKKRVGPDGEALSECSEEWVGSGFGRKGPIFDDHSLGGRRCGQRFENLAADGIEDDARAFARGDLVDAAYQVFLVGDDNMICPLLEEFGLLCCGAGDSDASGTLDLDHLDSSDADAAAGRGNDHKVSFRYVAKPDEPAINGEVLHPDGCA